MCTVNNQDYESDVDDVCETTNTRQNTISDSKVCKKCGALEVHSGYEHCDECFTATLTHKFKATLGKSKTIRRGDSVLVAHSGKANSTVLLHLIGNDANEQVRKKLLFRPKVVYIDDGAAKGRTVEQRESILRSTIERFQKSVEPMERFGKPILIPLYRCLADEDLPSDLDTWYAIDEGTTLDTDGDETVRKIFAELEDDTARDELLRRLRRKLLLSVAQKLGCSKVFLADTMSDLAAKVLADVSTGRGARLSVDVGFSDTRCEDVTLLRPLKNLTHEDLTRYLEIVRSSSSDTAELDNAFPASIRSIARSFVRRLNKEFRSTVSTIYRTSEKLVEKTVLDTSSDHRPVISATCVLCDVTLDRYRTSSETDQLTAVQATIFSKLISSCPETARLPATWPNERNDRDCRCPNGRISLSENFRRYLCYGCALIFSRSDGTSVPSLPGFVASAIQERESLLCMREEIKEFLL